MQLSSLAKALYKSRDLSTLSREAVKVVMSKESPVLFLFGLFIVRAAALGGTMTICPVAIAVTCEKCPVVKACPAKTIIGDYPKEGKGKTDDKQS